jgi:hypothetical protein
MMTILGLGRLLLLHHSVHDAVTAQAETSRSTGRQETGHQS